MTTVLPGEPVVLHQRAAHVIDSAIRLDDTARELTLLSLTGRARALTAVARDCHETTQDLISATERLRRAGYAIYDYSETLLTLHRRAEDAIELRDQALMRARPAQHSGLAVFDAFMEPASPAVAEANADIARTRFEFEEAAGHAIARLRKLLDEIEPNLLDHISQWNDNAHGLITLGVTWQHEVFRSAWTSFKQIVMTITSVLNVATLLITLCAVATIADPVLSLLAIASTSTLAALVIQRILNDVSRRTPVVTVKNVRRRHESPPRGVSEVLRETVQVDEAAAREPVIGGGKHLAEAASETAVKVTKVVDLNGQVRWRVVLPSTQDWLTPLPGGDRGATNDLDSNLALMITPMLKTQYQRAVLVAMNQAGVAPDDPVMVVGFSQGGIMAAHLAAYTTDYNWSAVVASGAPIDATPIPAHVTVVSVQHRGDPVHLIDTLTTGRSAPAQHAHWHTITADTDGTPHSARSYADTLGRHGSEAEAKFPHLDDFFVSPDGSYGSATQFYSWHEAAL